MKTLIIYPDSKTDYDSCFYLIDPETGEELASHYCSGASFARGDLHNNRPERRLELKKKYGVETEAKFINETNYDWNEICSKNKKLKSK